MTSTTISSDSAFLLCALIPTSSALTAPASNAPSEASPGSMRAMRSLATVRKKAIGGLGLS